MRLPVTQEAAGSSPVVPAILFSRLWHRRLLRLRICAIVCAITPRCNSSRAFRFVSKRM